MPRITINEQDYTSSGAYLANENVVYIPGFSIETVSPGVPTLCTTVEEFVELFGATPRELTLPNASKVDDKSFVMAHELLKLGMYVLYEVPATAMEGATAVTTLIEMEAALVLSGF